jgi:hypothetical protein
VSTPDERLAEYSSFFVGSMLLLYSTGITAGCVVLCVYVCMCGVYNNDQCSRSLAHQSHCLTVSLTHSLTRLKSVTMNARPGSTAPFFQKPKQQSFLLLGLLLLPHSHYIILYSFKLITSLGI